VVSPKKSKSGFYLEVTTGADADEERLLLLHPVRDLTTGDDPVSGASLVKAVYQTVRRPQQVRMGYMEGPKVIQVEAPWRAQEAIDAYLTQLRKAGRAGNAAPPGKAPGGP
jgi:hypothetical protein